ncbi:PTS system, fructose subfamily, IIA component [Halanaerobium saccharolyticum subsp. saccharolyticum DSM 6643]|uniref:PTS system, fructose subfamily, IIA component n=1 Tax=Halanaerobium saccharolyticum subsp. saccharolyticum DSM 6643 TaxID=1293054 RepID=M5EHM6_9FIRM|nr:fructose PTS transporter subunit IIA [Halanaerobium saccharolyticum]CCU80986.1 PTS system, fructose subfamily, IIA component [Halanaerobium saccharolyticum subsp. saccharolyticum DSM 6643]
MNEIININLISLDLKAKNKEEVIKKMAKMIEENGNLTSSEEFVRSVLAREEQTSTGVGREISIPHGKSEGVKKAAVAFARLAQPVEWESFDDKKVKLVFLLAVPEKSESNQHLKILSTLSRNLLNEDFKRDLLQAENKEIINSIIQNIFA